VINPIDSFNPYAEHFKLAGQFYNSILAHCSNAMLVHGLTKIIVLLSKIKMMISLTSVIIDPLH